MPRPCTLLCLATAKGLAVAASLPADSARTLAVCTFKEAGVTHSHHADIEAQAARRGIPMVPLRRWGDNPLGVISSLGITRILCVGWRYLVPRAAALAVHDDVIVAHDSLLPRLRGFAPLPTALLLGHERVGVTFLRAAEVVDAGPILWQQAVPVGPRDTIADLISAVAPLYVQGVRLLLSEGFSAPVAQDESKATYSLWRDELDYRIDWTQDATMLERMVRAVGAPYQGARSSLGGHAVVVRASTVVDDLCFELRQPGKVWTLAGGGRPVVVCGRGLLRIDALEHADGRSALPLTKLRQRFA